MTGENELTFVVKVSTTDKPDDQASIDRIAHFIAVYLNRGFGMDRISILHEGRRLVFDPDHDAEHYSSNVGARWIEIPDVTLNGKH